MSFDKHVPTNDAERFVKGKTAAQVVAALVAKDAPKGTLEALNARFERKAAEREARGEN